MDFSFFFLVKQLKVRCAEINRHAFFFFFGHSTLIQSRTRCSQAATEGGDYAHFHDSEHSV